MENLSPKEYNKATFANASFISRSIRNPKLKDLSHSSHPNKLNKKCDIIVVNQSCIFPYFEMLGKGLNPLLLDMANEFIPGGGVLNGSSTQEEYLCCISNLYVGLRIANDNGLYPIKNPFILDHIIFFKDKPTTSAKDILTTFYEGSVIICPALKLDHLGSFNEDELKETKRRIKVLLEIASTAGFRNLVLSAFGCGSFRNDPKVISKIFYHYLKETDLAYYFDHVIFAIIDDKNSNNNFSIFSETFSK